MKRVPGRPKKSEATIKDIRRKSRRQFSSEEKIAIVIEGLRGEESIAEICRREGITSSLFYSWSKSFLEAGKRRLSGDTTRDANSNEVVKMRDELGKYKELVAELTLSNHVLKKISNGLDS
ncbi:MAG: hypothetical protein COA49_07275 [Bacteroidetes bacterium]|nr:MAG: hypothetical protein COA49_07275 [Bacteroidota bacterium]